MKTYSETINITPSEAEKVKAYLAGTKTQGHNDVFSKTVIFPDGMELDVKCCSSSEGAAWTEAVLFDHGCEVCCSEPADIYLKDWALEYKGTQYNVCVAVKQ